MIRMFSIAVVLLVSQLVHLSDQQQDVIDYDDEDPNNGFGDSFQPSVKASCVGGSMNIRVDTQLPFSGIIHTGNRSEPGCSTVGRDGRKTYLKIDLTRSPGTWGSCGVKYDQKTEERRVTIAVRAHPTIELLEDRIYKVTCGRAGFQNSRNSVSIVQLRVVLPSNPDPKIDTVLPGKPYKLRAEVLDHDPNFDILVRRCFAFDETDTSLQLVDERGCKDDKVISEFSYDKEAGTAEATIYSMFRLPHSNRTYFQCDVAICKGECPKPICSKDSATLKTKGELQNLGDRDEQDPFERAEDDAVTTSTSVFIATPGSAESSRAVYCSVGLGPGDQDWLTWLCIAFGILFAIMLLINIFLCSAMTCSCTKSEIIEKEPSIYDDYSIYDSQYGYTNGKAYSESDYGSEFGQNGVAGGQSSRASGLPSEAGTQNYQQSTLGRRN